GYPADEETYRKATRLVPTQLECDNYSATRQPDSTITAPVSACHLVSYTDTYSRYMSNSYKLSGRCKLRSPAVSGEACLRKPPAGVTGSHRCTALPSSCIMRGSVHGCALGQSMARRRVSHEVLSRGNASCAGLAGARDRSARASWRPNVPRQAACPHRRARCSSDPMAALDTGLLQAWPRGDDGMAQAHRVYFLGTLTRNPEVRYAANGMA